MMCKPMKADEIPNFSIIFFDFLLWTKIVNECTPGKSYPKKPGLFTTFIWPNEENISSTVIKTLSDYAINTCLKKKRNV